MIGPVDGIENSLIPKIIFPKIIPISMQNPVSESWFVNLIISKKYTYLE